MHRWFLCLGLTILGCGPASGREPENLLRNPGFEEELAPAWDKRTPDDDQRKLDRVQGLGRSGQWCLVLENRKPVQTRLRQGQDHSLVIAPGSLVELSAWVKAELDGPGTASVQMYCMDPKEKILAQPAYRATGQPGQWSRVRALVQVPPGTEYCMVYVQIRDGTGRALFDDVGLRVVCEPRPLAPAPKIGLLTDLPSEDECLENVKLLLAEGLVELGETTLGRQLADCAGAVVLSRAGTIGPSVQDALAEFARRGGAVFVDLRAFAAWRSIPTATASVAWPPEGEPATETLSAPRRQMLTGLRVSRASPITAGFEPGQIIPYSGKDGKLLVLDTLRTPEDVEVLAAAPDGRPGVVRLAVGRGQVAAPDVLSLREPYVANIDAYYKYLFLANALARPESLQLAEYYPRKLPYAEFVDLMRRTAEEFPAIQFKEEGPGCGDYKIYSLNLGRPGAPLYFLYAAAHGSEWEPGYGLLTLAKRLAQGRLADAVDLDKVCVKIVPLLNPSGYDLRQRHNAHGVDLNRQGDYRWELYPGRDSNKDGTYGPGDSDWKGTGPFCEPEAQTYRRIVQSPNLHCLLDFHGNSSGAGNNKVAFAAATAREDNQIRALDLQRLVNQRLRRRYVLRQSMEKVFTPYLLEHVGLDGGRPLLMNTGARDRYGLLVELTAGYPDTYGTVLQTEVTCEVCRALFLAFPVR